MNNNWIINNGRIFIGENETHSDFLRDNTDTIGGGQWHFDTNKNLLYCFGASDEFGVVDREDFWEAEWPPYINRRLTTFYFSKKMSLEETIAERKSGEDANNASLLQPLTLDKPMFSGIKESVSVTVRFEIAGNLRYGYSRLYRRGRETCAFTLDDIANIIYMWDNMLGAGSTYAMDGLMQELEKILPKKDDETAQSVFEKYWINPRKWIDEEFEKINSGKVGGEFNPWPAKGDYLKYLVARKCESFWKAPLVVKQGFLYWMFKYLENSSWDEMKADLDSVPQYIRNLVDNEIVEQNNANENDKF